jgi:serine/threonine-protein kinase Chk2
LFPLGSSSVAFDLTLSEYSFGRGENCDYQFNSVDMIKNSCFQAYSKVHFRVKREYFGSSGAHVLLYDESINGTFVNGNKVGRGCKQVLMSNDEISLAVAKNKVFVYVSIESQNDSWIPRELSDKYTIAKVLGRGACGEVRLAFTKGSCKKVAVKVIQKKRFTVSGGLQDLSGSKEVMNEVQILKSLQHPCIIAVEDVIDTPTALYIIMELVDGGELFDRVVSAGHLSESTAKLLFYQMVLGVKYLHDRNVSHRDLKPENILLSSDEEETLVKVTDFGLSKFIDGNTMLKTFCGTPNYLAPEILLSAGSGSYTKAIDCWSLGVILFICLAGYPPFSDDRSDKPLNEQILRGDYQHYFHEAEWNVISSDARNVVERLMCVDYIKRITLAEALDHPWLKDSVMIAKANKLVDQHSSLPTSYTSSKRKHDEVEDEDAHIDKK